MAQQELVPHALVRRMENNPEDFIGWLKSTQKLPVKEHSVLINSKKNGKTLLQHAIMLKNVKLVCALITAGAYINAKDNQEKRACDYALHSRNPSIITIILKAETKALSQETKECPICFDEWATKKYYEMRVLHSCCHQLLCKTCYEKTRFDKCPLCRADR